MKNLTSKEVLELFPNAVERSYSAGQIVMYQGDQPSHMFYIKRGSFKYYDIDQAGNEKILSILGTGTILPMFYAFGSYNEVQAFYSTLDDSELLLIPVDDFNQRIETDAGFSILMLRWFVYEAEFLISRIKALESNDAKGKVIETLQYLLRRHSIPKTGEWQRITFPLSQQIIADMTGLTRETISAVMKEIEALKVIRYPKQLHAEVHKKHLLKLGSQ